MAVTRGRISGWILDAQTGDGLRASISAAGPSPWSTTCLPDGSFSSRLLIGTYTVQVAMTGYVTQTRTVVIAARACTCENFDLARPGPPPVPPTAQLSASPTSIQAGQQSTLSWQTTNATTVSIDQGIGPVAASGTRVVSPSATTIYRVTATGPGGTATAQVTVTVTAPPPTTGTVAGVVTRSDTGAPLAGAHVMIGAAMMDTDSLGRYSLQVAAGQQTWSVSAANFTSRSGIVAVTAGQTATLNVALTPVTPPPPSGTLWSNLDTWQALIGARRFPTRNDDVVVPIGMRLVRDVDDAQVRIITVRGTLADDRQRTARLQVYGNMIVEGLLDRGTDTDPVQAVSLIEWPEIDEARFIGLPPLPPAPPGTPRFEREAEKLKVLKYLYQKPNPFGGGMDPAVTDRGLWIMGNGQSTFVGRQKIVNALIVGSLIPPQHSVTLDRDPLGWRAGHVCAIAPTRPPVLVIDPQGRRTVEADWTSFDVLTIQSVSGRTVTFTGPAQFPHPAKTLSDGTVMTAEVMNLSADVRLAGTENRDDGTGRRMHVFIRSIRPQVWRYAEVRFFGPRREMPSEPGHREKVLGRYGDHFHHNHNGSRGSVRDNCVWWDGGNHVAVPHLSHGITYQDCGAFRTYEPQYWWDEPVNPEPFGQEPWPVPRSDPRYALSNASDDVLWLRCVGMLARLDFRGSPAGQVGSFVLGAGNNARMHDCKGIGFAPGSLTAGVHWTDDASSVAQVFEGLSNLWDFRDYVGHNNGSDGIANWQNDDVRHLIPTAGRVICYHNGDYGIEHGAYLNRYLFGPNVHLEANGWAAFGVHAQGRTETPGLESVAPMICDAGGQADPSFAFVFLSHAQPHQGPTFYRGITFRRYTRAAIGCITPAAQADPTDANFVNSIFEGPGVPIWINDDVNPGETIRLQPDPRTGTGAVEVRRRDQGSGTFFAAWNARVRTIAPFA